MNSEQELHVEVLPLTRLTDEVSAELRLAAQCAVAAAALIHAGGAKGMGTVGAKLAAAVDEWERR